jgi:hypothetical protein
MVVGAAGDQVEAPLREGLGQRPGIRDDGMGVCAEGRRRRLAQRDRDRRRGVVVRAALQAREHGLVQGGGVLRVGHQHRPTRPAQRLVGGGGDDRGVAGG